MSTIIDLTTLRGAYFNDFMNNLQLNPGDYSSKNLSKFHKKFQKQFYDTDGINKFFVLTVLQLQVAWVLYYMYSRYTSIKFKERLQGNSVNGKMVFMETINHQNDNESIFVKFQIRQTADDIRVDGLNAFIFNILLPNSPHFMEYHDMFKTLCLEQKDITSNYSSYVWHLGDQLNNGKLIVDLNLLTVADKNKELINKIYDIIRIGKEEFPYVLRYANAFTERLNVRYPSTSTYSSSEKVLTAFVSKRIYGGSLRNCLAVIDINTNPFDFLIGIFELFSTLFSLRKIGFIHNDAHSNNLLWDKNKHSFCLIDYGRSSVSFGLLKNELKNKINEYTKYVLLNTDEDYLVNFYGKLGTVLPTTKTTYEDFVNKARTSWICEHIISTQIPDIDKQIKFKKWMVMFDILTITLSIYYELNKDIRDIIDEKFYLGTMFQISSSEICVMELNDLLSIAEDDTFITNLESNNLDCLLPGIIWLSLIFTALQSVYPHVFSVLAKDPTIQNDYTVISADRLVLANEKIMYTSFQCLENSCHPNICDLIDEVDGLIEAILTTNTTTNIFKYISNRSSKKSSSSSSYDSSGGTNKSYYSLFDSIENDGMEEAYTKYNRTDPSDELKKLLKSYKVPKSNRRLKPILFTNRRTLRYKLQYAGGTNKIKNYMNSIPPLNHEYMELMQELKYYKPF